MSGLCTPRQASSVDWTDTVGGKAWRNHLFHTSSFPREASALVASIPGGQESKRTVDGGPGLRDLKGRVG